jgi:hypothetical protein
MKIQFETFESFWLSIIVVFLFCKFVKKISGISWEVSQHHIFENMGARYLLNQNDWQVVQTTTKQPIQLVLVNYTKYDT